MADPQVVVADHRDYDFDAETGLCGAMVQYPGQQQCSVHADGQTVSLQPPMVGSTT